MMSQSLNTEEKLINSAIKIFAEKGFWKAKVSDIVNDAGVAQGTFYIYFESKNDCFKNLFLSPYKSILYILRNQALNVTTK